MVRHSIEMRISSRYRLATLALVMLWGCSRSDVGRVTGKVTLDGQPLSQGTVVFEDAAKGISVNAELRSDGSYEARTYDKAGLPPGSYQVAVTPRTLGSGETPLIAGPPSAEVPPESPIPAKYRDVKTSGLTVTVVGGASKPFNIELKR